MYLVGTYKYQEYKIEQYIEDIKLQNEVLREKIWEAENTILRLQTPASINKSLKIEAWLKNPWEEIILLISENEYSMFTQTGSKIQIPQEKLSPHSQKSLIQTMSPFEKWIYLFFEKDIR